MAFRNQPIRTAFRILLASVGLTIAFLASIQVVPHWRPPLDARPAGIADRQESDTDARRPIGSEKPPPPLDSELPALSGSATSGSPEDRAYAVSDAPEAAPSTLEFDHADPFEVAAAPQPPSKSPAPSFDRLLTELHQLRDRVDDLEGRRTEAPSVDWTRITESLERLESHAAEVQATLAQWKASRQDDHEASDRAAENDAPAAQHRILIRSRKENGEPRLDIEARDASLPELLARLGEAAGLNLLVAPDIAGVVSLHLQVSDANEALSAVCRIHHCRLEQNGVFTIVSRRPPTEPTPPPKTTPETVTKLYRLKHLSASEIRPYVAAMLTPGVGTISFASIRERVARTVYRDPPRAILVKDLPSVITDIDRLILELDRPPAKGQALPPLPKLKPTAPLLPSQPLPNLSPPPQALLPPSSGIHSPPALLPPASEMEVFEPPVTRPAGNTNLRD